MSLSVVFYNHKLNAKRRGIPFLFSGEEWFTWWYYHLGYDWRKKRGQKRGKYVMSRFNDVGPYSSWNVECILSAENTKRQKRKIVNFKRQGSPGERNGSAKLADAQVRKILLENGSYKELARKYGVVSSRIYRIKTGRVWRHITAS